MSSRLRIALDLRECLDPWTGMGRYGIEITRALAARGRHDYVAILPRGARVPRELPTSALELLPSAAPIYSPLEHLILPGELRRARVDVLHALTYALPLTSPVPTSLMLFDVVPLLFPAAYRPRAIRYWRTVLPRTVAQAERIGTLSRASRDDIVRTLGVAADKIRVLRFGVGTGSASADDLPAALAGRRYVLAHGNQRPHKNLPALLDAFARLSRTRPDLVLALSGGIRAQSDGADDRILELGRIDDHTLSALYRHAAVYVLPSLYEGAGLTPLEAMARGTPCVVSDRAALPELYADVAEIATPDAAGLATAIARVLDDTPHSQLLRARGLVHAGEHTWAGAAAALEAMLEEVSRA